MAVDFWWDQLSLLLHMDGADGGTTFTDVKGHTVTVGGAVTTETTLPKFGTACGDFPGADADKLTLSTGNFPPANANFGSGNFTIEGWFKENNVTRQYMTMLEKDDGAYGVGSWSLLINRAASSDGLVAFYSRDFHATNHLLTSTVAYDDNAWHHVAVVRNWNQWLLWIDGALAGSETSTVTITDLSAALLVGNSVYTARGWTGTLDEWRITKGFARYTVPFTAPTTAFPGEADDGRVGPAGAAGVNIVGFDGPPGEDGTGVHPVTLPLPPATYDVTDQAQTRRLIEGAFRR